MKNETSNKEGKPKTASVKKKVISKENPLSVGDVFLFNEGKEYVVWFRNESRAAIAPLNSPIQHRIREEDGRIVFLAPAQITENISPNSLVEVLRSLGRKGLADHIDNRKDNITTERSESMKTKKKEKGASHGKLGGYKGHSITSTIRAFGAAGWTLDEARAFFKREKITVADNTIKIQLRRGANGDEDPAPLSKKELAAIKPNVPKSEKTAKKKDKGGDGKKKKAKASKEDDGEEEAEEEEAPAAEEEEEEEAE